VAQRYLTYAAKRGSFLRGHYLPGTRPPCGRFPWGHSEEELSARSLMHWSREKVSGTAERASATRSMIPIPATIATMIFATFFLQTSNDNSLTPFLKGCEPKMAD
jgi:hypothetical protein